MPRSASGAVPRVRRPLQAAFAAPLRPARLPWAGRRRIRARPRGRRPADQGLAHLSEEELIGWIFTEDTPDPGAPVPREDRLLRVMAAIALAIAIVLIVIVLFR